MAVQEMLQIGEVAEAVGLSIRTIRHYGEIGVVEPSGRSAGGFRLYTNADVERLRFVKRLKPLGFTLEEIQELLRLLDSAAENPVVGETLDRLEWFVSISEERCEDLRAQLAMAEGVTGELRQALPALARRRR